MKERFRSCNFNPEWKLVIISTFIAGLAAHGYKFLNMLPTWDSMYGFYNNSSMSYFGRCFLKYANAVSSYYDIPWLIGLLSLIYISIVGILLVEMFEIKCSISIVLMSAMMATFPTLTATFAYMFWADAYMLGFLLAVMAVFITMKFKMGFLYGMVLICLSYGIYQSNISAALMIIIIILIKRLYDNDFNMKEYCREIVHYVFMSLGGSVLYVISYHSFLKIENTELSGYQGIGSVGIMSFREYEQAIVKTIKTCAKFLVGNCNVSFYMLINIVIIAILLVGIIYKIYNTKIYKLKWKLLWMTFLYMLMPFVLCIFNFASPDANYHMVMTIGFYFVYFMLLLLIDEWNEFKRRSGCCVIANIAILLLIYYNIVNANVAYNKMQLSYEKTYSYCQNIVSRIIQLKDFDFNNEGRLFITGNWNSWDDSYEEMYEQVPEITGVTDRNFLREPGHYVAIMRNYFGMEFQLISSEEETEILSSAAYKSMKKYPDKDSIKIINGIVVVMLPE